MTTAKSTRARELAAARAEVDRLAAEIASVLADISALENNQDRSEQS
jgi:hypothetical protein